MDHEGISGVAKFSTNRAREALSIYVFSLYMGLDMRYLFRTVIALRALPQVFCVFEHHAFDHFIQIIVESAVQSLIKTYISVTNWVKEKF